MVYVVVLYPIYTLSLQKCIQLTYPYKLVQTAYVYQLCILFGKYIN